MPLSAKTWKRISGHRSFKMRDQRLYSATLACSWSNNSHFARLKNRFGGGVDRQEEVEEEEDEEEGKEKGLWHGPSSADSPEPLV